MGQVKVYYGRINDEIPAVIVEDKEKNLAGILDPKPSQKLINHSPDGFNWGYGGSGPSQLALALILDLGVADWAAEAIYQEFKQEVVANLPRNWERSEDQLRSIVDRLLKSREK